MSIHYYSGHFNKPLPSQMVKLLQSDIKNRQSIAIIYGYAPDEHLNFAKDTWLDPARLVFDEYHWIDRQMPKEKAHELLRSTSVIILMGGYTTLQNAFLAECELEAAIKKSNAAVIIGFSAGAKNMGAKLVCAKSNGYVTEINGIFSGLGLDNFCYEPYFSLTNDELIMSELLPLSQELDIYATSDASFIRAENGKVAAFGDAYLISDSTIEKI